MRVYVCECVLACTTNAFALETNERLTGSGGVDPVSARRAEGRKNRAEGRAKLGLTRGRVEERAV